MNDSKRNCLKGASERTDGSRSWYDMDNVSCSDGEVHGARVTLRGDAEGESSKSITLG